MNHGKRNDYVPRGVVRPINRVCIMTDIFRTSHPVGGLSQLDWALWYARSGWPVFPLYGVVDGICECGKAGCGSQSGKHPRISGAFHSAKTDQKQIEKWWRQWPAANIGLAVGKAGLIVLDVDTPGNGHSDADGPATLERLELEHGGLPATPKALTGSGGLHFYFLAPDGVDLQPKAGIAPGLDVRCAGSYIVAPPSRHHLGGSYTWIDGRAPCDLPVAPAPAWLVEESRRRGGPKVRTKRATVEDGERIPQGKRNVTLTSRAGKMHSEGIRPTVMLAALKTINRDLCDPPMAESEVAEIASSVERYEVRHTRPTLVLPSNLEDAATAALKRLAELDEPAPTLFVWAGGVAEVGYDDAGARRLERLVSKDRLREAVGRRLDFERLVLVKTKNQTSSGKEGHDG